MFRLSAHRISAVAAALSLAPAGVYAQAFPAKPLRMVIGFPAGIPRIPLNLALLKSCDIVGVFWGAAVARDPKSHQQNIAELMALYETGKIRPHVSEHFPLARAPEAITHLASRKALGKVVVTID